MQPKTYHASGVSYTGSSGFTNFFGRMDPAKFPVLHAKMKAELGEHVIVDGNDDLRDTLANRPEYFSHAFTKATDRKVLAYYHTGVSGITYSGIVLAPEDFDAMTEWYEKEYGMAMTANPRLKLIFNSDSTVL